MAIETATVVVGPEWEMISASNVAAFRYEVILPPSGAMIYVGETAPSASLPFDASPRRADLGALGASKVYARTQGNRAEIKVLREASASNPAVLLLKALGLASLTVDAGGEIAATIAALQNKTAGSTIVIRSIKGPREPPASGKPAQPQTFWPALASKISVAFVETHPKALNSGLETRFDLTVNLAAGTGGGTTPTPTPTPVPVATVPAAMAAPTLTAGAGQITVERAAAPSNGGSAITGYEILYRTGTGAFTAVAMTSSPQALTGLTNGSAYEVQTRAVNAIGNGPVSPSASATPVAAAVLQRLALNAPIVVNGNSKNAQRHANDFVDYSLALVGGRFYRSPFFRQSKGGDSILDFQQRMDACLAIGSYNGVDGLLWLGDATNDIGSRSTAALIAAYRDCATQWFGAFPNGRVVIELTALNTSIAGAAITALDEMNAAVLAMAAESGWGGKLDTFDLRPLGKVSSGTAPLFDTSLSPDGKHYGTAKLAFMAAQIVSAKLAEKITTDALIPVSGDIAATTGFGANVLANYSLTDSNADGIPDGFTVAAASGAAVVSSMVTRNGRRASKTALTGSSTSVSASDRIYRSQTGLSILAGEIYEAFFAYEIAKSDGSGDTVDSATLFSTTGTGATFGSAAFASTGPMPAYSGVMRATSTPVTPGSGAATIASLSTELAMRHPVGTVDDAMFIFEGWYMRQIEKKAYRAPFNQAYSRARVSDGAVSNLFAGPTATKSGNVVNVSPGNVSGGEITITYQHRKDGVAISGATSRFYDTAAAAGTFDCELTYTNPLGTLKLISTSIVNP